MPTPDNPLADLAFAALVDRALHDLREGVSAARVERWRDAAGLAPEATTVDGQDLVQILSEDIPWPDLPKQFALGYAQRLSRVEPAYRLAFHARLAGVVRWIEEATPHTVRAEVRQAVGELGEQEVGALLEGMALDLARSSRGEWGPLSGGSGSAMPWLLGDLVWMREPTPRPFGELSGTGAASRVETILAEPAHRFDVVRRFASAAPDLRLLRSLCASPAFFDDDGLCLSLLDEGDSGQISCALIALHLHPGMAARITERLLEALEAAPFADVAHRIVEIHAQASLLPMVFGHLREALRGLVSRATEAGALGPGGEALTASLAGDARFFRQMHLVADVADDVEGSDAGLARALRAGCLKRFVGTFTRTGVDHPLNDDDFRARIGDLVARATLDDPATVGHLLAIGRSFGQWAERFQPADPGPLADLFHAALASVVLSGARQAKALWPDDDASLLLYAVVAQLATGPAMRLVGSGILGALEHRIEPGRPGAITRSLLEDVAKLESGGVQPAERRRLTSPVQAAIVAPGDVGAATDEPRERAFCTQAWPPPPARSATVALLRLCTGYEAVLGLSTLPMRAVGYRTEGELQLENGSIRLQQTVRLGSKTLRSHTADIPVAEVTAVSTQPIPWRVYKLFGLGVLVAGAVAGVATVFDGLRSGRADLAVLGAAIVALGLLIDGACHRATLAGRGRSLFEVTHSGDAPTVAVRIDSDAATVLMDHLEALA